MEKIKNAISKHDNMVAFAIIFLIASLFLFSLKLNADDDLWNFSNIYKMTNGYEIYKDTNVIITPLYFYIGEVLFHLLGANYLTFRLYNIIFINVAVYMMIYQLYKKLNVRKQHALLYTICIMLIGTFIIPCGAYNMLAILWCIIGIYEYVRNKEKKYHNLLQAFIIFLICMTKQNVGVLYVLGVMVYHIGKRSKREWIDVLKQIFLCAVFLFLYVIYMYGKGNLTYFLNYALGGIGEFATYNLRTNYTNVIMWFAEIILNVVFIWLSHYKRLLLSDKQRKNIKLLSFFSIVMLGIAYPIINTAHIYIGSVVFAILVTYTLDILFLGEIFSSKKLDKIKQGVILVLFTIIVALNIWSNSTGIDTIQRNNYFGKDSPYYGTIVEEETIEDIQQICRYIYEQEEQGRQVKIISYYSNLYMNILGRNNGAMDLPFYGNMGKAGEDGMIEEIKKLQNTKILILTEEDKIYQESKKVMDYIKNTYPKEGEIGKFSIYVTD